MQTTFNYVFPMRAICAGDEIAHAGAVAKVFTFDKTVVLVCENGIIWEAAPDVLIPVDDVIVTPLDSELDFFLSDVYPVDELPNPERSI